MANITPITSRNGLLAFIQATIASSSTYITKVQFLKIMTELSRYFETLVSKDLVIVDKSEAFEITSADGNKVFICSGDGYEVNINTEGMNAGFNCAIVEIGDNQITLTSDADLHEPDDYIKTEKAYAAINVLLLNDGSLLIGGRTGA